MPKAREKQEIHFQEYFRILWRRRWLVLTVFTVGLITTILAIAAAKPKFTGTAQMLIEREDPGIVRQGMPSLQLVEITQLLETYGHIFKTTDFLVKVADELNRKLANQEVPKPDSAQDLYAKEPLHWLFSNLRTITDFHKQKVGEFFSGASMVADEQTGQEDQEGTQKEKGPYTAAKLLRLVSVRIIPRTQVIEIKSTHPDPHQAAQIANTTAGTFIKERLNRRLASTNQAIQWLQTQLKQEQTELDTNRIELYNFMQQFGILSLDESRSTKVDEEVQLVKEKVRDARQKTDDLRLRYDQTLSLSKTPGQMDTIPEAATNEILKSIRTEEIKLEQESIKLASAYGSNNPKIQLINKQLSNIRESKNKEIQKIVNSIKYQYETAQSHEKALIQSQDNLQAQLEEMKKKTIRYYTLKREVDSSEKVYDVLLNRFKETGLSEEIGRSTNISIIETASIPTVPTSPNIPRVMAIAVFLASVWAWGWRFSWSVWTIPSPNRISWNNNLDSPSWGPSRCWKRPASAQSSNARALVSLDSVRSSGAEAYRALRTSILLSSADLQPQVLLVTSPGKSEGKTSTAANLAAVMAQAGNRVLLVDCDLRKPKLHKMFGLDRSQGLSNLLVSRTLESDAFIQQTPSPSWWSSPAGQSLQILRNCSVQSACRRLWNPCARIMTGSSWIRRR